MSTSAQSDQLSFLERVALLMHRQLDRRLSRFGVWIMRRTNGSLAGRFNGFVVVATNDGGRTHPAWYLNLAASGEGYVEIAGRRTAVRATELRGDPAATWWARILDLSPEYERYTRAAGRSFPIVRLTPIAPVALP
jgi:deazaflavin-dependent oxidoreductase (nitroreductase family)